jgi:hypothetical protein
MASLTIVSSVSHLGNRQCVAVGVTNQNIYGLCPQAWSEDPSGEEESREEEEEGLTRTIGDIFVYIIYSFIL